MESPWILVLSHEFPPLGGGAGKNLCLLCRELIRRGVRVEVWTVDPGKRNQWKHEFPVEYIATERTERFETGFKGLRAYIRGVCALGWRRRSERPALVLANLAVPAGVAGWFLSRLLRAPMVIWHHGNDVHGGGPDGPGLLQRFMLRRVWKRSSLNFYVSQGLLDQALALGRPGKPRILPPCLSPDILAQSPEGPGAVEPEKRCFLFLGRFEPVKHPLLALEALLLLKQRKAVARRLRMVGSGELGNDIVNTIRNDYLTEFVVLEAAVSFDKVPELLRSAYALVVPSRIEGFSSTILEAAWFGVPAIASDVQGIRDFVRHGETGLLFPENDAAALAEALQSLSANPALRDELGRKARAAVEPYRPGRVADVFLAGIAECAPGLVPGELPRADQPAAKQGVAA
jgi:glycosyltransferase involved in cell wall biosynthesis